MDSLEVTWVTLLWECSLRSRRTPVKPCRPMVGLSKSHRMAIREVSETEQKATLFRGPVARNGNALQRTKPLKGGAVPERAKKGGSQPNDCRPPVILR